MIHIGMTGTQTGMTQRQKEVFKAFLVSINRAILHHGDCVGADEDAHNIATELDWGTVVHPPEVAEKRAFCEGTMLMEEKPYLVRNHDIVDHAAVMFGFPRGMKEELRSGTWATIRYARKKDKKLYIIYPDGSIGK